eukprot:s691_g2.t1
MRDASRRSLLGNVGDLNVCAQVDLKSYEVEVVAFVSDGVDELQVAAGAKRSELMGNSELLLLGLRSGRCRARQVTLGIQKGDLLSRADDTAALCVAQKALEFFRDARHWFNATPSNHGQSLGAMMHACCIKPAVEAGSQLSRGRGRLCLKESGAYGSCDDGWLTSDVSREASLPPLQWSPRRPSVSVVSGKCPPAPGDHLSNAKFAHLPSVGTWLQWLPKPLEQVKPSEALEPLEPLELPKRPTETWRVTRPKARAKEALSRPKVRTPVPPRVEPLEEFQGYMREGELWPTWVPCYIHICWDRLLIMRDEMRKDGGPNHEMLIWLTPSLVATMEDFHVKIFSSPETDVAVTLRGNGMRFNACLVEALQDAVLRLDESISSKKMSFVYLNVYDLFNWQVGLLNNVAWSLWGAGAFHVGLQIYGNEYAFGGRDKGIDGSGITHCKPRCCPKHSFRESLCLGVTSLTKQEVDELLHEVAPDWSIQAYETLGPNCVTFCRQMCKRLAVQGVPDWVDSMARSIKERRPVESLEKGHCAHGHVCQLQAQGIVAGLIEVITCVACGNVIEAGAAHWHCDTFLRVLDPMCGVGTYLFALQWALSRMAPKTVAEMWGADAEAESLMHATSNAKLHGTRIDFFQGYPKSTQLGRGHRRSVMARIWDFSVSFEPKIVANAMARFWKLNGWKFTPLVDANERPVDHCPISLEPMEDPVLVCDGHIYDKDSITRWLSEGNKLSPCTGEELVHTKLLRIQPFCSAIEKFLRHLGELTEAEIAARQDQSDGRSNHGAMHSCMELAAFLERKLLKNLKRPKRSSGREKRSTNSIYAGQMAFDALQQAIKANQAEIDELQAEVNGAQKQLESLQKGIEEEAARVVQRFLQMKPLREKWLRGRAKVKAWRDRSEKLAKQCAMAMANGREEPLWGSLMEDMEAGNGWNRDSPFQELVNKFQSKGDLDYSLVLKFLKSSTDVNQSLPPGVTPLYKAAMAGQVISARLLCKAGADKDAVGPSKARQLQADLHDASRTALYAAAQGGHVGVVKLLCGLRADTDKGATRHGSSPAPMEVVKILCSFGAATNKALIVDASDTGLIPLHAAAKNGHFEVVRYLCACRGDVTKATLKANLTQLISSEPNDAQRGQGDIPEVGITPLFLAVRGGHSQIVQFLCTAQADVNKTLPDSGCTTLHMACRKGNQSVVQILLNAKANVNIPLIAMNRYTPLHAAASAGCEDVVSQLCQARAKMDQPTGDIEATPLYLAAAKGFVAVVKVLCRSKADVNKTPTCTSATPLYMACLNGHLEVVQSLCLARADLNKEVLRNRQTPLFVAAKNGHLDIAKTLSAAEADLHKASSSQVTPLHMAAMNGHYDLVEGLVRNKAEVNMASKIGTTPLHLAALSNHPRVARYLCAAKADKNVCAKKPGSTPLMMAVLCGNGDMVDVLCDDGPQALHQMLTTSRLLLHVASRNGHEQIVWRLCSAGANANDTWIMDLLGEAARLEDADKDTLQKPPPVVPPPQPEPSDKSEDKSEDNNALPEPAQAQINGLIPQGEFPLMAAARESFTDVIQILLAARADVNQTKADSVQDTALTMAAEFGLCPVAHELCKARADVNKATAETGATAMLIAAENGHSSMVDLLGACKADPNKALTTPDGLTSIAVAARKGSVEVVNYLLQCRADLNQPCSERMLTPLMLAAEYGHTKLIQRCLDAVNALASHRADINARATNGATPLSIAAEIGEFGAARSLIELRANLNQPGESGFAPVHCSVFNGDHKLVEYLMRHRADVNVEADDGTTPLHAAMNLVEPWSAEDNDIASTIVLLLLQGEANVNKQSKDGQTPVVAAVEGFQAEAVKLLCERRADVEICTEKGTTALLMAAETGQVETADVLIKHKADVNRENNLECRAAPLHIATFMGSDCMVRTLVAARAQVDKTTTRGHTALHYAAWGGHVDVAKALLEAGADKYLSVGDPKRGINAIFMADQEDVLQLLFKSSDQRRANFCNLLLHVAARNGQVQTVKALCESRCDVNKKALEKDIAGLVDSAKEAQCQYPCNTPSTLITLEENFDQRESRPMGNAGPGICISSMLQLCGDL